MRNRDLRGLEANRRPHAMAIRIYLEDGYKPMAEIALITGEHRIIAWDDPMERANYYFDAYTLFYDERDKVKWDKW